MDFVRFLSHEVLYTWCMRYSTYSQCLVIRYQLIIYNRGYVYVYVYICINNYCIASYIYASCADCCIHITAS